MTKCEWYYNKIYNAEVKCQHFRQDPIMSKFWATVVDIWTKRMRETPIDELGLEI